MTTWLLLAAAIASEVTATLSLKAAVQTTPFYGIVALGYVASFTLLALVLRRGMGLGVAYGIWSALGVALTAIASSLIFGEDLTVLMGVGITLVILGVLAIERGSHRARRSADGTERDPDGLGTT